MRNQRQDSTDSQPEYTPKQSMQTNVAHTPTNKPAIQSSLQTHTRDRPVHRPKLYSDHIIDASDNVFNDNLELRLPLTMYGFIPFLTASFCKDQHTPTPPPLFFSHLFNSDTTNTFLAHTFLDPGTYALHLDRWFLDARNNEKLSGPPAKPYISNLKVSKNWATALLCAARRRRQDHDCCRTSCHFGS